MIVDNFTSKYDMRAGTRNGVPVSTDEVAFGARVLATLAPFAQALTQIQAELARTDEETFLRVASQVRRKWGGWLVGWVGWLVRCDLNYLRVLVAS